MSGLIRWLAPHMFPQLQGGGGTPTAASGATGATGAAGDTIPGFMQNAQASGALNAPGVNQQALQALWARHFAPPQPRTAMAPQQRSALPPQHSAPPPQQSAPPDLHPQSIRVDFHPPPEPSEQDPLKALHFLHPGIGESGPAAQQPTRSPLAWPAGPGQ